METSNYKDPSRNPFKEPLQGLFKDPFSGTLFFKSLVIEILTGIWGISVRQPPHRPGRCRRMSPPDMVTRKICKVL